MNEAVKVKWVSALRYGSYEQTGGALHKQDGGFCCLGVLCDIAVKDGVIPEPEVNPEGNYRYGGEEGYFGSSLVLPRKVREWAGLEENPWVEYTLDGVETNGPISNLNDDGGDFPYVASVIEDQL